MQNQKRTPSAIGRPLDVDYLTNRVIVLLTLVVMVSRGSYQLFTGSSLLDSALAGGTAGIIVFVAWALGRELDPDYNGSAFVGAGLAFLGTLLVGEANLLALFGLMLLARIVNRTVGISASPLDSIMIVVFVGILAFVSSWVYGAIAVVAFLLDYGLPEANKRQLNFAGASVLVTIVAFLVNGAERGVLSQPYLLAVVMIAGLSLLVILTSRRVTSVGDVTGKTLNLRRIQAVQLLMLVAATAVALWQGDLGFRLLLPLWATFAGIALYRVTTLLPAQPQVVDDAP
jgi:hypothetical protein